MSLLPMSHVPHMHESRHLRHSVASHMSQHTYHVTHVTSHTSRHTHPISPDVRTSYIMFRTWKMNLTYVWDMTHIHVGHDSDVCVTWLICMCDMTHLYVWHDSDAGRRGVSQDSLMYGIWLIYLCDMTDLYVGHDSVICGTWLTCTCGMT